MKKKDNDNDNENENDEKNKDNNNNKKKYLKQKTKKKKANTITTNKHLYITDKTFTGEEREKKNIYYIQTMKELLCLICSVNITFIKTKRSICL